MREAPIILKKAKYEKNPKILIVSVLAISVLVLCWIGLVQISSYYVPYCIISSMDANGPGSGEKWFTDQGHTNVHRNHQIGNLIFAVFPWVRIPAIKSFLWNKKYSENDQMLVTVELPTLADKRLHKDALKILEKLLIDGDQSQQFNAATGIEVMSSVDSVPCVIEYWKRKADDSNFPIKLSIAHAILRIGDKAFIPVLDADVGKGTYEDVMASIALYKLTSEEKYKKRISEILKSGTRRQRVLAIVFLGSVKDEKMIPLLKQALKDPDEKLRKVAKKNINATEHVTQVDRDFNKVKEPALTFEDSGSETK